MLQVKQCKVCGSIKPISEFHAASCCKDGHRNECKDCARVRHRSYYIANADAIKKKTCKRYRAHRDEVYDAQKKYMARRPDVFRAAKSRYALAHPDRVKEAKARWRRANGGRILSYTRRRQAIQRNAAPPWLSEIEISAMQAVYVRANQLSNETGIKHHVDHIVPLQGRNVSGLHVPWNLQILTAAENIRKSNKLVAA